MNFKEYFKKNKVKLTDRQRIAIQVGGLITQARLRSGFTQAKLAKKIGTKQASVARAENGSVLLPSILFLSKIAKATGGKLVIKIDYE